MGTSLEAPPFAVETSDVGANDQLKNIIMTTRDLPAMPQVASKVLELSSDPNTSAQQLQQHSRLLLRARSERCQRRGRGEHAEGDREWT